jgi:hypothetical protein
MNTHSPADAIKEDDELSRAPNPRRHYPSPEDLLEDIELDLSQRQSLLEQWRDEVEAELAAESEGMSASDPIRAETEARLAAEARRVNDALVSANATTAATNT